MYNKVIIMGRLTADPELRQTPNNISVTSFTVACDRAFTLRVPSGRRILLTASPGEALLNLFAGIFKKANRF